jgi:hypothetical protein
VDWLTIWNWLANPDNQKTLGVIGTVVAAVIVAFWQVYVYFDTKAISWKNLTNFDRLLKIDWLYE